MNRRFNSSRGAGRRRAGLLALLAIFWLAQLQGVSHLVSHLGLDRAAPHALVCGDCIAAADAGAAPIPALAEPALLAPASEAPPQTAGAVRTDDVLPAYRSRAPPAAST